MTLAMTRFRRRASVFEFASEKSVFIGLGFMSQNFGYVPAGDKQE
jgi:hypothetical protein